MKSSWIKYFRCFEDEVWRTDPATFSVFMFLLVRANYQKQDRGKYTLNPGQLTTTYAQVCNGAGITDKVLRRVIRDLTDFNVIKWEGLDKYSIVTFVNWDFWHGKAGKEDEVRDEQKYEQKYEVRDEQKDEQRDVSYRRIDVDTDKRIESVNTPLTPQGGEPSQNSDLKKEGEISNTRSEQPTAEGQKKKGSAQKRKGTGLPVEVFAAKAFPDLMRYDESAEDVLAWVSLREAKARTERAAELIRKKWKDEPLKMQLAVVRQSVEGGWKSIYPLKDQGQPGQKSGQSGQKPAYQTAQVNFKKEEDLIDLIKFYGDDQSKREYTLECRAKLYLVRKGKDSQDPNLLKSVKEAHETGKLNLEDLDLNPTQTNA